MTRRYGRGGRIEEADGTRYRHDDDGNLVEKTDVLGETTRYRWNGAGMLEAVALSYGAPSDTARLRVSGLSPRQSGVRALAAGPRPQQGGASRACAS